LNLVVPDASVAAKWFLPRPDETLAGEAIEVLRQYERGDLQFIVPGIFWAEIGNIFWKAARFGRWPQEAALAATGQMLDQRFPTVADSELLSDAVSVALAAKQTVYDSLYIALALRYDAEMITADQRLANSVAATLPVKWLGAAPFA
jgi:predicted nucleic acid-binding protein